MSRFWFMGEAILVLRVDQRPYSFTWSNRQHRIVEMLDDWRFDGEWWRFWLRRDYYEIYTDTDLWAVIYCDLNDDSWYLQRLYD